MSTLRYWTRLSSLLFMLVSPLMAQYAFRSGAVPAAKGPDYDVSVGYSYLEMNLSGTPVINLSSTDASASMNMNSRWGATMDSSYVRAGRDPLSGHGSYVLSFLAGPVFVPAQNENTRLLVRTLAGVSLVDGSVPVNQLYYRGWLSRFCWGVGTGVERNISGPIAVRINADYLRTKFVNTVDLVTPQNDIRLSGSLVFHLGIRHEAHQVPPKQR